MRRLRFWLIYLKTLLWRYKLHLVVVILVIVGVVFVGVNYKNALVSNSVSEGIVGTYTKKDLPVVVTSLLSKGLVRSDDHNQIVPELVSGWQVNQGVNEYNFKLKDDLHWSDGSVIKAAEIALPVADVAISFPDEQTINFKLAEAFSPFPSLLTRPILKKNSLVGTGPYMVESVETSSIFVKKIKLISHQANLPNLIIRFYPNEKTAISALKIGEIQSLLGVNDSSELVNEQPLAIYQKTNYSRIVTIFYNTKDQILSDENFRLALSFGAPSIKGEEMAHTSIPGLSWAFNPEVKDYLDNAKQAKTHLDKVKNGKNSTIILTATSSLQEVGNKVVEGWNRQGMKAVLRVESGIPQNFQALLIAQNIPIDPDQYSLWHGTQAQTNIAKVSLPRVDKDLEDGRKTADLEQRKTLYKDFQKVLLDHAPATFLYFPKNNVVYLKKIESKLRPVLEMQLNSL